MFRRVSVVSLRAGFIYHRLTDNVGFIFESMPSWRCGLFKINFIGWHGQCVHIWRQLDAYLGPRQDGEWSLVLFQCNVEHELQEPRVIVTKKYQILSIFFSSC
jgi:hypothetical protein